MVTDGSSKLKPGMELVLTKWIALEGTARIARDREKELTERFPRVMIKEAQNFNLFEDVSGERKLAEEFGEAECFPLGEGGILSALWKMTDAAGVGLQAELRKIPIRQETIEICELFDINPYGLCSKGALLIGTWEGYALTDRLNRSGISAAVIGRVDNGNERVLYNQGSKRFVDKPGRDEIYKLTETGERPIRSYEEEKA